MENQTIEPDNRASIRLYEEKCVVCKHLFPSCSKSKFYIKCHYTKGNTDCPAQDLKFIVGVNVDARVDSIISLLDKGDFAKLIRVMQRMVKLDKSEAQRVLDRIRDKLAESKSESESD